MRGHCPARKRWGNCSEMDANTCEVCEVIIWRLQRRAKRGAAPTDLTPTTGRGSTGAEHGRPTECNTLLFLSSDAAERQRHNSGHGPLEPAVKSPLNGVLSHARLPQCIARHRLTAVSQQLKTGAHQARLGQCERYQRLDQECRRSNGGKSTDPAVMSTVELK